MFARTLTELQAELPALSVNRLHITVDGATHESLVAEREHALVAVDAIRRVLEGQASGSALAEPMEMPRTSSDRNQAAAAHQTQLRQTSGARKSA